MNSLTIDTPLAQAPALSARLESLDIWYDAMIAVGAFLVLWLILLHMYRHRIFLKI